MNNRNPGCGFTLRHYWDVLQSALEMGYIFSVFTKPPDEHLRIYLRHDVDVSPEDSLTLAKLEHQAGVVSTYFVMSSSPFYNLLELSTLDIIGQIAELGHHIGLHIDERAYSIDHDLVRGKEIDETFRFFGNFLQLQPVISFHLPTEAVMNLETEKYVNAYSPPFFSGIKYISDSRRHWREGCFCKWVENPELRSLQILTHPVWWSDPELDFRQIYFALKHRTNQALSANLNFLADFDLPNV